MFSSIVYHARYWTALLFLPLLACEKKNPEPATPKATDHQVQVSYNGTGLTGLGAFVMTGTTTPAGADTLHLLSANVTAATVSQTSLAATVPTNRNFYVKLAFKNVKNNMAVPGNSTLQADIIVDGIVFKSVVLDKTTRAEEGYLIRTALVTTADWR